MSFSISRLITHSALAAVLPALTAQVVPPPPAAANAPVQKIDSVVVYGRSLNLLGEATAPSDGQVGAAELAARPFLRRGELLEVVPGVVITQHSGSGKANQYFLRGFNLDHGTDFAVTVDGMPVNLRSHAHGQGYSDLNFIIPELVQSIAYQKGAFTAANGDFSAAGAAQFHLATSLPQGLAKVEFGEDEYARAVFADTLPSAPGATTLVGAEMGYSNGPWLSPERSRRFNGLVRHAWTSGTSGLALTALAYHGAWRSTDQVPGRAIDAGTLPRFGFVDPSDAGASDRASLSLDWTAHEADATTRINAYAIAYRLNLFSDFTYFLDDPVNGDQFNQRDKRGIFGASAERAFSFATAVGKTDATVGVQLRHDSIGLVLRHTVQQRPISTVRTDDVEESSAGAYVSSVAHLSENLRVTAGVRGDFYRFHVDSDNPLNSGTRTAVIASPKVGFAYVLDRHNELYLDAGYGFHSNDARGATIRVDPTDGVTPVERVNPLARARSYEVGLRTSALPGLVSTVSVWLLDLDSELVFVGDAGATEANGATRRYGVEFANFYRATPWLAFDADLAFTHARYRNAPGADHIANSIATVVTGGAVVDLTKGFFGSVRVRYFGPQPLIEDSSVHEPSSLTWNARAGWRAGSWELAVDVLNVFDRENDDIAYYYTSRLRGEPLAGTDDVHVHPGEPRTLRFSVTRHF